jgi:hypothetical protein
VGILSPDGGASTPRTGCIGRTVAAG